MVVLFAWKKRLIALSVLMAASRVVGATTSNPTLATKVAMAVAVAAAAITVEAMEVTMATTPAVVLVAVAVAMVVPAMEAVTVSFFVDRLLRKC